MDIFICTALIFPMIKQQMSRTRKGQRGNLLGNTLQYPSNGSLIRVKIVKWDDFVVMEVADTGIGVPSNSAAYRYKPMSGNALLRITVLRDF
jgi:hypothetical protein